MICPDEIGEAILDLTRNSFGATREEIVQSCARTFGYAAVSTQFKSLLHGTLDTLVERNLILPHADLFVAAP
jgi:hypothetical protein